MEETEKILQEIIAGVSDNYTDNEKIRYVYLELGKRLSKNTDFFFSLFNRLEERNLTISELREIYNNEDLTKQVVCKTCVTALKNIFDRIGIESKIMKTINKNTVFDDSDNLDIYHYFLCCKGDYDKWYFLTLSADLGNIQMGFRTEHFANDIEYIHNGKISYEGEEIKNSVMLPEEIEKIDLKLGYLKDYYYRKKKGKYVAELDYANYGIDLLKNAYRKNDEYYNHLKESPKNIFYRTAQTVPCLNGTFIQLNGSSVDDIKKIDLSLWKHNILSLINEKIIRELESYIDSEKMDILCNYVNYDRINEWINTMLNVINNLNLSKLDLPYNFNPIVLIKRMENLFHIMDYKDVNVKLVRARINA